MRVLTEFLDPLTFRAFLRPLEYASRNIRLLKSCSKWVPCEKETEKGLELNLKGIGSKGLGTRVIILTSDIIPDILKRQTYNIRSKGCQLVWKSPKDGVIVASDKILLVSSRRNLEQSGSGSRQRTDS